MRDHLQHDQRSLDLHRLVADKMRREPALVRQAQAILDRWQAKASVRNRPYLVEWKRLLSCDLEELVTTATEDSERARALRQCSPLSCLLDEGERTQFIDAWRSHHAA